MTGPTARGHHRLGSRVLTLVHTLVPDNPSATDVMRLGEALYRCLQAGIMVTTPGRQRREEIDAGEFRMAVLARMAKEIKDAPP